MNNNQPNQNANKKDESLELPPLPQNNLYVQSNNNISPTQPQPAPAEKKKDFDYVVNTGDQSEVKEETSQQPVITNEVDPAIVSQTTGISEGELALQQRPIPDDVVVYDSLKADTAAKELDKITKGVEIPPENVTNTAPLQQPEIIYNQQNKKETNEGGLYSILVGFFVYIIFFIIIGVAAAFAYNTCFVEKTTTVDVCEPVRNTLGPLFGIE